MDGNIFHSLSSLDVHTTNWRVIVRVTRLWASKSGDGVFRGSNLIFLDAQNYHMAAFVRPDLWNALENIIIEGKIYEVYNFIVKEANGEYRPVHSNLKIFFSAATMIRATLENQMFIIPRYKFDIVQLPELHENATIYATDHTFALDVIGVLDNLQPVQSMNTRFGVKPVIRFRLCHGRFFAKVHIYDELTESMTPLFEDILETPVIVVLSSVHVGMYKGNVTIINTPASRIYINPNCGEVFNLRHWLDSTGHDDGPNNN